MASKRSRTDSLALNKKRKTLSLECKLNIIKDYDAKIKICELAKKFDLPESTVRSITKSKEKILEAVKNAQSLNSSIIRKRHGIIAEMETLLKLWCDNQVTVKNCPVDQNTVCFQAKQIFEKLKDEAGEMAKDETFKASNGWFSRFKSRCNWHSIAESGEAASADKEAASLYPEKLKAMIDEGGYTSQTIFNVDETGLFWKKMPKRTFIAREEKTFPGFKAAKDRLTVMLGANAAGDFKLKPLLVYRSENPRALKNKSKAGLPVIWKSNRKAWVTASLFEDWFGHHFIPEVERYCQSKQIPFKVMLLIDNAPGHPPATLTSFDPRVKVEFLPPNTTSLLQPMDQGVIKTFKAYYTRRSFAHLHKAMRQNNELSVKEFWKQFNILEAVRIIGESWDEISQKTLNGVWKKLCPFFFSTETQAEAVPGPDEISNVIKDVVELGRQINLEVDSDDVQELLDSHNEELTIDELITMREQEENIDNRESLDPVQLEDQMTVGNLTEALSSIEKGLTILESIDSNEERIFVTKHGIKSLLTCYEEILREKKKSLTRQTTLLDFMKPSTSK